MSDLAKASITSLRLALGRSLNGDGFVVMRTCRWIKNHIENIDHGDTLEVLKTMVESYLEEDDVFITELMGTFCSSQKESISNLMFKNLGYLRSLKTFLEERIDKKKGAQ